MSCLTGSNSRAPVASGSSMMERMRAALVSAAKSSESNASVWSNGA